MGNLSNRKKQLAVVGLQGAESTGEKQNVELLPDTGISKTLLIDNNWSKIKKHSTLKKTSKLFRPYGTPYHLPIRGKAKAWLSAENGARIYTTVYILKDKREQSLLGEADAERLGIVKINLKGATEEMVNCITPLVKQNKPDT